MGGGGCQPWRLCYLFLTLVISGDKGLEDCWFWVRGLEYYSWPTVDHRPLGHQQAHDIRDRWNVEAYSFILP